MSKKTITQPNLQDNLDKWSQIDRYSRWMYHQYERYIGQTVLEVGAGLGRNVSFYINGRQKVVATDVFASEIKQLKSRFSSYDNFSAGSLDIMKDDLRPYRGKFDTVVCINTIEHLPDDLKAVAHMKECLSAGGHLIILAPALSFLFCHLDENVGHYRRYDRGRMKLLAQACDMKIIKHGYFNFFGIIPYYIKGKFGKNTGGSYSTSISDGAGKLINALSVILEPLEKLLPPPAGISEYIIMEKKVDNAHIANTHKQPINWWWVISSAFIAEVVGFASNLLCGNVKGFYASLALPPFSPPGWLFGVVWVVLYAVMGGIAGWLIGLQDQKITQHRQQALILYWLQLAINFVWSPIFFYFHHFPLATAVVLLLVVINVFYTLTLVKINKKAAYLMIPYLAWLVFASYLTIGVLLLN